MANNRIYLRCKKCKEEMFLGKRFGKAYYWVDYTRDKEPLDIYINAFFELHEDCGDSFEIAYEIPPKEEIV